MQNSSKLLNLLGSCTLVAFLLCAKNVSADTTLTSFNFDLDNDAIWSNGLPGAGNNGFIHGNYNFEDLGRGNVDGNFLLAAGTYSVTQIAGDGLGDHWNLNGNSNVTFNLNGGSLTSAGGAFLVNGTNFNIGGGSLTKSGGLLRLLNLGSLTVSSGSVRSGAMHVEGGSTLTIRGGTLNVTNLLNRGGTTSMSGGTFTNTNISIGFNRNNGSSRHTVNLSGGTAVLSAVNFLNNTGQITTIGGDFELYGANIVNLFGGGIHTNSSTINFTSDWTGSLTLDASIDWSETFENGDVSVDGVELGKGDFETYFQNTGGVIVRIPGAKNGKTVGIPEPSEFALLAGCLSFGAIMLRRRRN